MDTLNYGLESQQAWALLILKTFFEVPGLDLGQDCQVVADPNLTHPLVALLETERSHHALQVCLKMCMLAPLLASWRPSQQVSQLMINLVCILRSWPHVDQGRTMWSRQVDSLRTPCAERCARHLMGHPCCRSLKLQ